MGTIMKAECADCGFEKELFIGGGKMDCNIEAIMDALSENLSSSHSPFCLGQRTRRDGRE